MNKQHVTKSELIDMLRLLVKMHGERDKNSDLLKPPDLQSSPEIGEAMRLIFKAGSAV